MRCRVSQAEHDAVGLGAAMTTHPLTRGPSHVDASHDRCNDKRREGKDQHSADRFCVSVVATYFHHNGSVVNLCCWLFLSTDRGSLMTLLQAGVRTGRWRQVSLHINTNLALTDRHETPPTVHLLLCVR